MLLLCKLNEVDNCQQHVTPDYNFHIALCYIKIQCIFQSRVLPQEACQPFIKLQTAIFGETP